jgi:hypothetical protein
MTLTTADSATTETPEDPRVEANLLPTRAKVSTTLSEDTWWGDALAGPQGHNKVAMFANPFAGQAEEILFIDSAGTLSWARHSNETAAGWTSVPLGAATEVVTAVHPRGVVFAFAIQSQAAPLASKLTVYVLERTTEGSIAWTEVPNGLTRPLGYAAKLSVQYEAGRPANPVVFLAENGTTVASSNLLIFQTRAPSGGAAPSSGGWWQNSDVVTIPTRNLALFPDVLCAVDGPHLAPNVMVWTCNGQSTFQFRRASGQSYVSTKNIGGAKGLAGLYATPLGVGLVGWGSQGAWLNLVVWRANSAGGSVRTQQYVDILQATAMRSWQDDRGLLHAFVQHGSDVSVIHQVDVVADPATATWIPQFTTRAWQGQAVIVSTPLAVDVVDYTVDAYPDQYPSQFMLHGAAGAPTQDWSIYTQDVYSTWWSREDVRFQQDSKLRAVTAYKSQITLVSAYGGPVACYPVSLTAAQAVEVVVSGKTYRLGPDVAPTHLMTDFRGCLTFAVPAVSLAGVEVTLSAVGLASSVTVNPATDVLSYLGGAGTLPNRQQVITAETLRDAKTSDGRWVVPGWHVEYGEAAGAGAAPILTPDQVLTLCAELIKAPGADPTRPRFISLQASDPERAAYASHSSTAEAAELRAGWAADPSFTGFLDGGLARVGDFWEAINAGAVRVQDALLDLVDGTADLLIVWIDGLTYGLTVVWDTLVQAARVIEAIFNAIVAAVKDVIDWLKWALDLGDIFLTKDAMLAGLKQVPEYYETVVDALFDKIGPGWFASKKEAVTTSLETAISSLQGASLDPVHAPNPAAGPAAEPGSSTPDADSITNPHFWWSLDAIFSLPDGSPESTDADELGGERADPPPEFTAMAEAFADLGAVFRDDDVAKELTAAWAEVAQLFSNLLDWTDFQTLVKTQFSSLIRLTEHLVLAFLEFCEVAVEKVRAFVLAGIRCIPVLFDLVVEDPTGGMLQSLWTSLCELAGRPVESMSYGNLVGVLICSPLCSTFKAMTGAPPFPDGKFPSFNGTDLRAGGPDQDLVWVPQSYSPTMPNEYVVDPEAQYVVQSLVGVATAWYFAVDSYMNAHSAHKLPHTKAFEAVERCFLVMVAGGDLLAFVVGDLPIFWGVGKVVEGVEVLWYAEYIPKTLLYLCDLYVCIVAPLTGHQAKVGAQIFGTWNVPLADRLGGNNFATSLITVFGYIEAVISAALYGFSEHHPADLYWLVTQIIGLESSLTAFLRLRIRLDDVMGTWASLLLLHPYLFGGKVTLDILADVGSGLALALTGGESSRVHLNNEVAQAFLPTTLPAGVIGQPYQLEPGFPVEIYSNWAAFDAWTPLGWTIGSGELPAGLYLGQDPKFEARIQFRGTPEGPAGTYSFQVWGGNSFDPNNIVKQDYQITITA